jgi:hypothetical protein
MKMKSPPIKVRRVERVPQTQVKAETVSVLPTTARIKSQACQRISK